MRILNSSGWELRVVIRLEWVLLLNTPSSPPEALHWNTGVYRFQYHSRHLSAEMLSSTLFSSVPQSCLTLCDPMECSTPGFPVHHQLLELAQTHVHPVSDATQPSHPHIIMHLSKSTQCTPRVNPEINCGLWGMMTCQCRCILCNNCAVLVRDVDNGGDCAYPGSGNIDTPQRCRGFTSRPVQ